MTTYQVNYFDRALLLFILANQFVDRDSRFFAIVFTAAGWFYILLLLFCPNPKPPKRGTEK